MKSRWFVIGLAAVLAIGLIGYAGDEDNKKEPLNDYYNSEEFKGIVDKIITNYGTTEALKEIKYCRSDARSIYTHDNENYIYETVLFCAITGAEPAVMKYRREDYLKGPKDIKKQLLSGVTFNGSEVIRLPKSTMGTIGLENIVSRFFDAKYPFTAALNLRLTDGEYSVAYKGKQKNKELGKEVYAIELKDTDPEKLQERITTLYYNPSSYLLEAMQFENEIEPPDAPKLPPGANVKVQNFVRCTIAVVKEHKSFEIAVNGKKQAVKYVSKLSCKSWMKTGDPKKDVPPKEGAAVEIKTSFNAFDEAVFDKKE